MVKSCLSLLLSLCLLAGLAGCQPRTPSPPTEEVEQSQPELLQPVVPEEVLAPAEGERRITLVVTGDLMVHTEQLLDAYDPLTDTYDFTHCFAQVAADLQDGDYCIGNLETVFAGEEDRGYSSYPMFNTPDAFGHALRESGFDFLTTVNNHSLDRYESGLLVTLDKLDEMGFAHTGTFASRQDRDTVNIQEVGGIRIAFLGYTFSTNGIPIPEGREYLVNMIEETLIIDDLAKARELGAELVVILPHMGNEYETYPRDPFINWMDLMINYGADLVLASHPHVLQPMRFREVTDHYGLERDSFVIYSLGNFISSQRYEPREQGIILKIDIVKYGDEPAAIDAVRFVPTWVQFVDQTGAQLVRVLPIADALQDYENGNTLRLRPQDAARMQRAHADITAMYLGAAVPAEQMQREYTFYTKADSQAGEPAA